MGVLPVRWRSTAVVPRPMMRTLRRSMGKNPTAVDVEQLLGHGEGATVEFELALASRMVAVCWAVHTATTGRSLLRCHATT